MKNTTIEYVDPNNLTDSQKSQFHFSNSKALQIREKTIFPYSTKIKSWIRLVTYYQFKLFQGAQVNTLLIDGQDELSLTYNDAILTAYYKNIHEGLYLNNKLYYMNSTTGDQEKTRRLL